MRRLHAVANWIRQLFRTQSFEREMRAEMQSHLVQQAAIYEARGMNAPDAMAEARRDFGNAPLLQEQSRDARGTRFIEETKRDLLYGMRALLRTPGFTIVAILSLALGIGVNTAMLTFMRYLFSPTHLEHPETYTEFPIQITYPTWKLLESEPNLYEITAAYVRVNVALEQAGHSPMEAEAQLVSDGYFPIYGTRAHLGRTLLRGENNDALASPAIVLSYPFWQRAFGGDSAVIGRTVRTANGSVFTIVGVATNDFAGAERRVPDFWAPLSSRLLLPSLKGVEGASKWLDNPGRQWLTFTGRLVSGVNIKQARVRAASVFARSATVDTTLARAVHTFLTSGSATGLTANNATSAALIFSATFMVLLIGCANVANLMLARGVRRRREIAVRLSLGATRVRLIRQLATESLVLAFAGGGIALALSMVLLRFVATSDKMQEMLPNSGNMLEQLRTDSTIVVITFIAAFLSAVASGLLPAFRSTKMDLSSATRDDGAAMGSRLSRSNLRSGLVIGQVALSLVLLISASVLVRSARNALVMDLGFERDELLTVTASTYHANYSDAQRKQFGMLFEQRVASLVDKSKIARGSVPTRAYDWLYVSTSSTARKQGRLAFASENYFSVMGIELTRGRAFTAIEVQNGAPIVVVSEQTARILWPDIDPLGQTITVGTPQYASGRDSISNVHAVTVVGVARDAQITKVGLTPNTMLYMPADSGDFLVRLSNPGKSIAALRDAARIVDPNVLVKVETMNDIIARQGVVQATGVTATYAGVLGLLALLLSAVGIFGVVAYAVSQRTREIGVRIAIGAQRSDVVAMVLRQGMKPVLYGAIAGVLLAIVAMRVLQVFLFGISFVDPLGYTTAAIIVGAAAGLACYFPARRAATIDPVTALRRD